MPRARAVRRLLFATLLALAAVTGAASAKEAASAWHRSLDEGLEAARKSRRPVLVVTLWPPDV